MAAAGSADACAAYVSLLRARRLEDERTRKRRGERRADLLNDNVDRYKSRERRVRGMLMRMKLKSLSRVEQDLYEMLDEQAQWRHVMRENVRNREAQQQEITAAQQQQRVDHLEHVLQQEVDAFGVAVNDDEARWQAVRRERETDRAASNTAVCSAVLGDVVDLAADVVGFIHDNMLKTGEEESSSGAAASAFDLVPRPVFDSMRLNHVYGDDEEAKGDRLLEQHATLQAVGAQEPDNVAYSQVLSELVGRMRSIVSPPPDPLRPKAVSNKAFVVLSGPKYSGKSMAARQLSNEFGLEYVSDVSVMDECLSALEGDITAEDLQSREMCDRLSLAREVRVRLQHGQEVDDTLLAELVLFKIRYVGEESAGILFDGIPRSREAFEAIEADLSGYRPDWNAVASGSVLARPGHPQEHVDPTVLDVERPPPPPAEPAPTGKEAKKVESKTAGKKDKKKEEPEEPLPAADLPVVEPVPPLSEEEESILAAVTRQTNVAGLQRVIRIECDPRTLFERYCGQRIDSETGEEYHVVTRPPPLDRMPFLVAKDRSEGDTAKMHAAIEEDREAWDATKPLLGVFSNLLNSVDGATDFDTLLGNLRDVTSDAVSTAQKEFEAVEVAKAIHEQRKELEAMHEERLAHRESVRKQLHQLYTERGVDPMPAELAEPPKPPESPLLPMPGIVPNAVLDVVKSFERYYAATVSRIHAEIVTLIKALFSYGVWAVSEFSTFCAQPDGKQKLVDGFVRDMNAMPPALRSDSQCKDELHLRADALWEALVAIADKRRDDGSALIDDLLAPQAFLENWNEAVRFFGTTLMQLELERLQMVRQIASVYYGGIKGDPITPEDPDALVDLVIAPKGSDPAADAPPAGKPNAKDAKAKAPPAKKGGAAPPPPKEEEPKSPEEFVAPIVEKAATYMRGAIERLQASAQPAPVPTGKGAKGKNAPELPPQPEVPTAAKLSVPLMQSESDAARHRIENLAAFLAALLRRGASRSDAIKSDLQQKLKHRVSDEMSAVNGATVFLRSAVEEESPVVHAIVLEGDKFRIDFGRRLVPTDTKLSAPPGRSPSPVAPSPSASARDLADDESDPLVTSSLRCSRLNEIVQSLRAVAPDFAVHLSDLERIVSKDDWKIAGTTPASVATVFQRFDTLGGGAIDWRELIVHILFWNEPLSGSASSQSSGAFSSGTRNQYYIDGPTLLQLFDLKTDLGLSPLTKEQFMETELFFEVQVDMGRLLAYKECLWDVFVGSDGLLDPNDFVMFLCADEQPLRGVQKAFAMAAEVGDEICALTPDMMYSMFHFSSCNAAAFGMDDMYSHEELNVLFAAGGNEALNFQEVCGIGMGRIILNNTTAFRKKRFAA